MFIVFSSLYGKIKRVPLLEALFLFIRDSLYLIPYLPIISP